jgi:FkbM family methyltransferase
MKNYFQQMIGRHRFLSRKLRNFQPKTLELSFAANNKLFVDPKDLYGPSYYAMYGRDAAFYHYEEEVKAEILEHLPMGGVFFDVGANIGLISLFISRFRKDVRIYAFEPSIVTSAALEHTVAKNKIQNIHLVKKGVSNKSEDNITFFIDSKSSGGNSLLKSAISHEVKTSESISLVSLDDFILSSNTTPAVVKVDVQDAESFVIEGAKKLIKATSPTFIIETNNELLLKNPAIFIESFENYFVKKAGTKKIVPIVELPALAQYYISNGKNVVDYVFSKHFSN